MFLLFIYLSLYFYVKKVWFILRHLACDFKFHHLTVFRALFCSNSFYIFFFFFGSFYFCIRRLFKLALSFGIWKSSSFFKLHSSSGATLRCRRQQTLSLGHSFSECPTVFLLLLLRYISVLLDQSLDIHHAFCKYVFFLLFYLWLHSWHCATTWRKRCQTLDDRVGDVAIRCNWPVNLRACWQLYVRQFARWTRRMYFFHGFRRRAPCLLSAAAGPPMRPLPIRLSPFSLGTLNRPTLYGASANIGLLVYVQQFVFLSHLIFSCHLESRNKPVKSSKWIFASVVRKKPSQICAACDLWK